MHWFVCSLPCQGTNCMEHLHLGFLSTDTLGRMREKSTYTVTLEFSISDTAQQEKRFVCSNCWSRSDSFRLGFARAEVVLPQKFKKTLRSARRVTTSSAAQRLTGRSAKQNQDRNRRSLNKESGEQSENWTRPLVVKRFARHKDKASGP